MDGTRTTPRIEAGADDCRPSECENIHAEDEVKRPTSLIKAATWRLMGETMEIRQAQQEVRTIFLRGSVGQAVAGLIWLVSAALGTWVDERSAILELVLAGIFIYPLTQSALRLLGRPAGLPRGHPMNQLAMEVAFIVPLSLPVIGAAALHNINWFYPAFMIILGVHYMPFIFLYGMWEFGVLAALLIAGGVAIGMILPGTFTPGGWFAAAVLAGFALAVQIRPRLSKNGASPR